jgi:uncharacterized protein YoaH (UPF0181 family)
MILSTSSPFLALVAQKIRLRPSGENPKAFHRWFIQWKGFVGLTTENRQLAMERIERHAGGNQHEDGAETSRAHHVPRLLTLR